MAVTLSNGYILPQNPDTGDVFWPALATDINLMNNHVHDGVTGNVTPAFTQSISSANWIVPPVGDPFYGQPNVYMQLITLPVGAKYNFSTVGIEFRNGNGSQFDLVMTVTSSSTYKVYINDNTQNLTAVYTT